jgi:hypothetical protein
MELNYVVHFSIRKGMGPEFMPRTVFVGLDDIPNEASDAEIKEMVIADAETQLMQTDDFPVYGKNWIYRDMPYTVEMVIPFAYPTLHGEN